MLTTNPIPEVSVADEDFATALWVKSNNSGDGDCVEVALHTKQIGVRDTKEHGTGPILAFSRDAWTSFVDGVRAGDFTHGENRT